MKLQTLATIELSSACNLSCEYCINKDIFGSEVREYGIMSDETFDRSMHWLRLMVDRGTQQEINLNGNGESTLDPQLIRRAGRIKAIVGKDREVILTTNGLTMTEEYAFALQDSAIDRVDVSPHSPYHGTRANYYLRKVADVRGILSVGMMTDPHTWAGQLNWLPEVGFAIPCLPLIQGRGYIQMEGDVVPCCYDYLNLGTYGNVYDDNLDKQEVTTFGLCEDCHQVPPDEAKGEWFENKINNKCGSSVNLR